MAVPEKPAEPKSMKKSEKTAGYSPAAGKTYKVAKGDSLHLSGEYYGNRNDWVKIFRQTGTR